MSMFGMVLNGMVYGIIIAITCWILWMTYRNIAGFISPVIRVIKTATPVVTRSMHAIAHVTVPAVRSAARLASPYVALATHRIAMSVAKAQANAAIIKTNWKTAVRR